MSMDNLVHIFLFSCTAYRNATLQSKAENSSLSSRLLARWPSRHPVDGHLKLFLIIFHVALWIVHLSRPCRAFWTPTFRILAKSLLPCIEFLPIICTWWMDSYYCIINNSVTWNLLIIWALWKSTNYASCSSKLKIEVFALFFITLLSSSLAVNYPQSF